MRRRRRPIVVGVVVVFLAAVWILALAIIGSSSIIRTNGNVPSYVTFVINVIRIEFRR